MPGPRGNRHTRLFPCLAIPLRAGDRRRRGSKPFCAARTGSRGGAFTPWPLPPRFGTSWRIFRRPNASFHACISDVGRPKAQALPGAHQVAWDSRATGIFPLRPGPGPGGHRVALVDLAPIPLQVLEVLDPAAIMPVLRPSKGRHRGAPGRVHVLELRRKRYGLFQA